MKNRLLFLGIVLVIASCNQSKKVQSKQDYSVISIDTSYAYFKYKDTLVCLGDTGDVKNYRILSKKEALKIDTNKAGVVLYFKDSALVTKVGQFGFDQTFIKFEPKYKFSDFSVSNVYHGKLAKPRINSCAGAYEYRTRIKEGCEYSGVNFAGHYTIVGWGCGTECINIAIVDRVTGQVYMGFSFQSNKTDYDTGMYGKIHQKDSRLLLINSGLTDIIAGYQKLNHYIKPEFYEWTGNDLKKLN